MQTKYVLPIAIVAVAILAVLFFRNGDPMGDVDEITISAKDTGISLAIADACAKRGHAVDSMQLREFADGLTGADMDTFKRVYEAESSVLMEGADDMSTSAQACAEHNEGLAFMKGKMLMLPEG